MNAPNPSDMTLLQWLQHQLPETTEFLPSVDMLALAAIDTMVNGKPATMADAVDPNTYQHIRARLDVPDFDTVRNPIISYYRNAGYEFQVCREDDEFFILAVRHLTIGENMMIICCFDKAADTLDVINITVSGKPGQ